MESCRPWPPFRGALMPIPSAQYSLILIVCFTTFARGQAVLDQSLAGTTPGNIIEYGGAPGTAAQTFTDGITGLFRGFDLRLNGPYGVTPGPAEGNIVVAVRNVANGVPTREDSLPIASLTVPVSDLPVNILTTPWVWTHFSLGANAFPVTSGEVLALSICNQSPQGVNGQSGTGNGFGIMGTTGPLYTGGNGFEGFYGGDWTPATFFNSPYQFDFQTYVLPQAVPEPSSMVSIFLLITPLLISRRRRNASPT